MTTSSMELLERVKTALADDALVKAWCLQNFDRIHTVCIDVDPENPVPDDDYPVIAVTGLYQGRGDSIRELSWKLEIGVGVVNEEISVTGNVREMIGFGQAQALRELAEDAIYRAGLGDVSSQAQSGTTSHYPLFISGSLIPIKILKSNCRSMPGRRI